MVRRPGAPTFRIYPAFANSVDPDQLASALFVIQYVNVYQQSGSSNLIDWNVKWVKVMKAGKAPGPSGIVVEMIRAAGDMGASMIRDLAVAIIRDGKVPSDWEQSFIVCLYTGKRDALEMDKYWGLKLTEQVMKILEIIVDGLIRQLVSIDDSQFGLVPGRGTTDAIFVVRQLQEKYLAANKRLYMAFIDLDKAFDWVPRKVIWWALRKLGVEEWIVRLV